MPVGKNTLAQMMKTICRQAGVSSEYSNHSIRATSITMLDINKFSSRDIMSVSGHKSESSLKNYTSRVSSERKHEMSAALSNIIMPNDTYENTGTGSITSRISINNVESNINCDGIIDMTPDQIEAMMTPMDDIIEQDKENVTTNLNMVSATYNNNQLNNVSVDEQVKENIPVNVNMMSTTTCNNIQPHNVNVPSCDLKNFGQFTPYITGCVVNFYMK